MANVARAPMPPTTRLTLSPVATENTHRTLRTTSSTTNPSTPTVATRRTSRSGPLLALADNEQPVKQMPDLDAKPVLPTSSRKRSATALSPDDATDTRPPTKVTVTQPHGQLFRITNGVAAPLDIGDDDVASARSTPRPTSAGKLSAAPSTQDKRSLRSHDGGSRLKSDLPTYFGNYDDIMAGITKPAELLDTDTTIYLYDEPYKPKTPIPLPSPGRTSVSPTRTRKPKAASPPRHISNSTFPLAQSSTTFQELDYSTIARSIRHDEGEDPLGDAMFFAQHRRAERREKQLRNIEKERAMHEKVQLERLLDGLQGPDWLKVMGLTAVTAGESKDWEPKRDYFIKEVEALVDKFRHWKDEEKRLRAEKEAALHAQDEDEEDDEESEESDSAAVNGQDPLPARPRPKKEEPPQPVIRRPPRPHGFFLPLHPLQSTEPFVSFFAKPHLRDAALGKARHGRNMSAFGVAIPDFEEHWFELPEDYLDPQFLKDNARQRRRRKRESGVKPTDGGTAK